MLHIYWLNLASGLRLPDRARDGGGVDAEPGPPRPQALRDRSRWRQQRNSATHRHQPHDTGKLSARMRHHETPPCGLD